MAVTIVITSGKGGVGKTSVTTNVGYILSRLGYRVLALDLDTTPGLTMELGLGEGDRGDSLATTLMVGAAITPVQRSENLDVICGGPTLAVLPGMEDAWKNDELSPSSVLRERVIKQVEGDYDFILIDTPPGGAGNAATLAIGAADYALIPTKDDPGSMRGITAFARQFLATKDDNPDLHLLGVVLFDVSRKATVELADARQDAARVLGSHGELFDTVIHQSDKASRRARKAAKPVLQYDEEVVHSAKPWYEDPEGSKKVARRAGDLAKDYLALTDEILNRITAHQAAMTTRKEAVAQ